MKRLIYQHPGLGDDIFQDMLRPADVALAKQIEGFLQRNYPRQAKKFRAEVDHAQGVVTLTLPALMGPINVYVLHIERLKLISYFVKDLHEACGQLLERFNLPRDSRYFSDDKYAEVRATRPAIGLKDAKVPE